MHERTTLRLVPAAPPIESVEVRTSQPTLRLVRQPDWNLLEGLVSLPDNKFYKRRDSNPPDLAA